MHPHPHHKLLWIRFSNNHWWYLTFYLCIQYLVLRPHIQLHLKSCWAAFPSLLRYHHHKEQWPLLSTRSFPHLPSVSHGDGSPCEMARTLLSTSRWPDKQAQGFYILPKETRCKPTPWKTSLPNRLSWPSSPSCQQASKLRELKQTKFQYAVLWPRYLL